MFSGRNGAMGSGGTSLSGTTEWPHPDQHLSPAVGVTYGVRYVGAIEVKISIKSVDFDVRTKIGKECIHRVCEEVGLKLPGKRKRDKSIDSKIGLHVEKRFAMTDAKITINTDSIILSSYTDNKEIAHNNLYNISFASGGDADTMDYVSYVAKSDEQKGFSSMRYCYVIECMGGLAKAVINTIGQAFKIRYQEFVNRTEGAAHNTGPCLPFSEHQRHPVPTPRSGREDAENEASFCLPGPPQQAWNHHEPRITQNASRPGPTIPLPPPPSGSVSNSDNLLDTSIPEYSQVLKKDQRPSPPIWREFEDNSADSDDFNPREDEVPRAPPPPQFLPQGGSPSSSGSSVRTNSPVVEIRSQPMVPCEPPSAGVSNGPRLPVQSPTHEAWYLGPMSRIDAEKLLQFDGDFLVRGSLQQPGQYILSGRQGDKCKHLLLVDPHDQVRTKDRVFDSISHLIQFHIDHGMPIKSVDSELQLSTPITKHNKIPTNQ